MPSTWLGDITIEDTIAEQWLEAILALTVECDVHDGDYVEIYFADSWHRIRGYGSADSASPILELELDHGWLSVRADHIIAARMNHE